MPDHPDREQLAAFQAGDGDRRQRAEVEAHLAGCPSCAEVVASVEQARRRLAVLEEPALPPGLHDRLAAAVETEAAQPAPANGPARWYRRRAAGRPHAHRVPWYRRPVAWGAAAALLLLAALIVPFLDRSSGDLTTAGGSSGGSSQEAATAGGAADADRIPVIRIPGEVSAGPGTQSPDQAGGGYRSSAPAPPAGAASLQPCLPAATAAAKPASRPLRPAFFIQGTYRGRETTILVTTSTGEPGRVDLWVFPRDDCSSRPLDTEQVR